jgi:hypothetical protein
VQAMLQQLLAKDFVDVSARVCLSPERCVRDGSIEGRDAASAIRLCDYESELGAFRILPFYCGIAAIADDDLLAVCL